MKRYHVVAYSVLLGGLLLTPVMALCQDALPIKDNSFLIEEAYNQEAGVVQWIVTAQHFASPFRYWGLGLTNELPLYGMTHQISYTVPFESESRFDDLHIGDISIHYRYQLLNGEHGIAVAPRLSAILATAEDRWGVTDDIAWQTNVPVSVEVAQSLILHLNAGATYSPNHEISSHIIEYGVSEDLFSYAVGGSLIWLIHPNANMLAEVLHSESDELNSEGRVERNGETVLNPGMRIAINRPLGQFVPGIGMPIRFSDGETDIGFFGYLSFEHSL